MKHIDDQEMESIAVERENAEAESILAFATVRFERIAIALAGAESAVIVDMMVKMRSGIRVFTLDTGRMHAETHRFIDAIRELYGVDIDVLSPEAKSVEALVKAKGLFSFYADGHEECCRIRKVEPMRRVLATVDAWITGQRRDSSPTRAGIRVIERDDTFGTAEHPLVKINPLATWSVERVWNYVREHRVPVNELYRRGFQSIGCEPCTRAVLPGEHERAGRWWWEDMAKKECGLHAGNLRRKPPS